MTPTDPPGTALPPDPHGDPILALAESVRDLAARVETQTNHLGDATQTFTEGLQHHRRATRLAFAALVVGILAGAIALHVEISELREAQRENRDAQVEADRADCLSDNAVSEAVVRAAAVAVERAAVLLADEEDPIEVERARSLAREVASHVAEDPALQQRQCPGA